MSPLTLADAVLARRSLRVLLAEDDYEMRTILARKLRNAGISVLEVASGDDALSAIADQFVRDPQQVFDVIIADVRMPRMGGLDLLATVRSLATPQQVILITGFGSPETHAQARALGAFAIFDKPFDIDELKTAVLNVASTA